MGRQEKDIELMSLGSTAALRTAKIENIRVIGSEEKLTWSREADRVRIKRPGFQPNDFAIVFEVS